MAPDGKWAIGRDTRGYISDYEPARADIYRVNTMTGERTLILKSELIGHQRLRHLAERQALSVLEGQQVPGLRPRRRHDEDARQRVDAELRRHASSTIRDPSRRSAWSDTPRTAAASSSSTATTSGCCRTTASAPRNLTEGIGSKQEIKFMPARWRRSIRWRRAPTAMPRPFDLTKPVTLSAYGEWTKKAGFYRAGQRQAAGSRVRGCVVQHAGEGRARPIGTCSPVRPSPSSRISGSRAPASRTRKRSRMPIRSRRNSSGDTGCCSTTSSRTASAPAGHSRPSG